MKLQTVVLAAACAAVFSAGSATAQAVFIDAQAVEVLQSHSEGVVNCRGNAQPSGNIYLPCGAGIPGTVRDRVVSATVTFASPYSQFSGVDTIVVNVNFDENGEGPMWGTFELALTGGGVVEGTYMGSANVTDGTLDLKVVGIGSGGVAEGLQFKATDVHDTPGSPVGNMQVRILNPGGKH
jgi:hypothetical protein